MKKFNGNWQHGHSLNTFAALVAVAEAATDATWTTNLKCAVAMPSSRETSLSTAKGYPKPSPHLPPCAKRCEVKITQDTAIQIYIWTFAICFGVTLIGIEILSIHLGRPMKHRLIAIWFVLACCWHEFWHPTNQERRIEIMKIFFIIPAYAGAIGHKLNGYHVGQRACSTSPKTTGKPCANGYQIALGARTVKQTNSPMRKSFAASRGTSTAGWTRSSRHWRSLHHPRPRPSASRSHFRRGPPAIGDAVRSHHPVYG